jgi:hypothetical protein
VAPDQAGLFSRQQALLANLSEGSFERGRRRIGLARAARGVYTALDLDAFDPRTRHLLQARALMLSLGDDWCAGRRTAAVLHGLPLLGFAPSEVQLTRPRSSARVRSSSRHRHINTLLPEERTLVDDLATTTLPRTVFDLARCESRWSAVVVMDAALRAGVPLDELERVLRAHPGWPGIRQARWALAFADGRSESPLESLGRTTCVVEGLPVFEPQVLVLVHGEPIARVDGLWRERLVVFEGDGAVKFDGAGVLPALLTRQERLREAGLPVVRADWGDLTRRRAQWAEGARRELAENPGRLRPGVELVSTTVRVTPLERHDHYRWERPARLSSQHAATGGSSADAKRPVA